MGIVSERMNMQARSRASACPPLRALAGAIGLACVASSADAGTITVKDNISAPADFTSSTCTLAQAIAAANAANNGVGSIVLAQTADNSGNCSGAGSGANSIVFVPALAGATLTFASGDFFPIAADNRWYGPNALPPIASEIDVDGGASGITLQTTFSGTLSTTNALRFFYVSGGLVTGDNAANVFPVGHLTLRNLTLRHGHAKGGNGGKGGGGAGMGGAIFNQGTVNLIGVTLVGNTAGGGQAAVQGEGGGGMGEDADNNSGGGFGFGFAWPNSQGGAGGSASSGGGAGFRPLDNTSSVFGGGRGALGGEGNLNGYAGGDGGGGGWTPGLAGGFGGGKGQGGGITTCDRCAGGGGGVGAGGGSSSIGLGGGGGFGGGGGYGGHVSGVGCDGGGTGGFGGGAGGCGDGEGLGGFGGGWHIKTNQPGGYGGGAGMLMLPEPIDLAFKAHGALGKRVVYMSPSGKLLDHELALELSGSGELFVLCGRYEGVDQRIIDRYVTDEVSIGDYVLSSGEVAALVLIDATYRLVEGVISPESLGEESFASGLLEYPQYTRPEIYDTMPVPEPLLSGHHANIARWRLERSIRKTLQLRPELIERARSSGKLGPEALQLLASIEGERGH